MIRDNAEFRAEQVFVKVYVLYKGDNDYTYLGEGFFEIVTDQLIKFERYQHYVEVSDKATNSIFLRSRLQKVIEYERQKSTIITWTDPEIDEDNIIGVTFEDESTCDMYWRLLCCKIGKSYLEINGKEKLQMPNQKNVRQLLEKIKSSFNLVAYHIINSKDFMAAFWQTLEKINKKDTNEEPMGLKVLRELMYHYDPKIMAIILSDPHFSRYLQIYQCKIQHIAVQCSVNYFQCYKMGSSIDQLIQLNQKAKNSIQLANRARFVKQCVISYEKDLMSSHMLDQVIKENETQALIITLNNNCIEKLVQIYENSKQCEREQRDKVLTKILTFILEAVWIIKIYHVDNTKNMFINEFYTKGMFNIMRQTLSINFFKTLEVLTCISEFDPSLFFAELTNDYRSNSGNSIVRVIGKYYSQGSQQYISGTINFLKSITKPLLESKSNFQLINKTLTFIVFTCCKKIEKIIPLLTFYVVDLGYLRSTIELLEKYRYFQEVKKLIVQKRIGKKSMMDIIKLIKHIAEENRPVEMSQDEYEKRQRIKNAVQKTRETREVINKLSLICIDSLLLKALLEYFETNICVNNMITSSIMQLIITISSLPYNEFTRYIKQYDHAKLRKCLVIGRHLQRIMNLKAQKQEQQNKAMEMGGRKKVHRSLLESQMQEQYLQNDAQGPKVEQIIVNTKSERQIQDEIKKLMQIKSQINQRSRRQQEQQVLKRRELSRTIDKILAQKKKEEQLELGFDWIDQF